MNGDIRDSNHTLYYMVLRSKRLFRDNVRGDLVSLWEYASKVVNAFFRVTFGFLGIVLRLGSDICFKIQQKWISKR